MKALRFEAIDRFLNEVGRDTLYDYLELASGASDDELRQPLATRRRWAQAQQANPKFRAEAVWLIRNTGLLEQALLEEREAYTLHLDAGEDQKKLQLLSLFIRGTLFSGRFTKDAEEAIRRQAARIGISEQVLDARIEELLAQHGAVRAEDEPPAPTQALPQPQQTSEREAAPIEADYSNRLNARLREVFAQGLLPTNQVEEILSKGRSNGFSARQLLVHLDRHVLEAQGISSAPPPRQPQAWQTMHSMDKQQLKELVDTLRGALMQDTLGASMERLLAQQAEKAGMNAQSWLRLLSVARQHVANFQSGAADPWQSGARDRAEAKRAYAQLRKWAWTHPDPLKCANTSLELDAAWAAILKR